MKTAVDVAVTVQHIDSLVASIDRQKDRLDEFEGRLEAALGDASRSSGLTSTADVQPLAARSAFKLSQQPGQAIGVQANVHPEDVLAVT